MKPLPLPTPEHLRSAARIKSGSPHRCRSFLRLFAREPLHFCASCGNIIRQYCIVAEYALVAQPVEHLTFNQRARDSSSLERTKIPRRIVRFLVGFSFFWGSAHFLHTGGKAVFFLALSALLEFSLSRTARWAGILLLLVGALHGGTIKGRLQHSSLIRSYLHHLANSSSVHLT